jgi:hypothetical protein
VLDSSAVCSAAGALRVNKKTEMQAPTALARGARDQIISRVSLRRPRMAILNINTGNQALQTNYAAALQPFTQNFGNATQGVGALGNALGLNGPAGTQSALTALKTTPEPHSTTSTLTGHARSRNTRSIAGSSPRSRKPPRLSWRRSR